MERNQAIDILREIFHDEITTPTQREAIATAINELNTDCVQVGKLEAALRLANAQAAAQADAIADLNKRRENLWGLLRAEGSTINQLIFKLRQARFEAKEARRRALDAEEALSAYRVSDTIARKHPDWKEQKIIDVG